MREKGQTMSGTARSYQRPVTEGAQFWYKILRRPRLVNLNLTLEVDPSRKEVRFSGVLEPSHTVLGKLIVIISSQPHIQWYHIGCLKIRKRYQSTFLPLPFRDPTV